MQVTVVGTISFLTTEKPFVYCGDWTAQRVAFITREKSMREAVGVSTMAMNNYHAREQKKNDGGASNALASDAAVDESTTSLASRVAALQEAKGVTNASSGLDTFDIPTLLLHALAVKSERQRTLVEAHVLELIVSRFRCCFIFIG